MNPPFVPKFVGERSAVPSGFTIETLAAEQHDDPIVTSESLRLTRSPAEPAKVSAASWPGTVVSTETGGPPGTAVAAASGGTS